MEDAEESIHDSKKGALHHLQKQISRVHPMRTILPRLNFRHGQTKLSCPPSILYPAAAQPQALLNLQQLHWHLL